MVYTPHTAALGCTGPQRPAGEGESGVGACPGRERDGRVRGGASPARAAPAPQGGAVGRSCSRSCRAAQEALTSVWGRAASGGRAEGRAGRRSVEGVACPARLVVRSGAPCGPRAPEAVGLPEERPRVALKTLGCRLGLRAAAGRPPAGFLVFQPFPFRLVSWEECESCEERFSNWDPQGDSRFLLRLCQPWPGNLHF